MNDTLDAFCILCDAPVKVPARSGHHCPLCEGCRKTIPPDTGEALLASFLTMTKKKRSAKDLYFLDKSGEIVYTIVTDDQGMFVSCKFESPKMIAEREEKTAKQLVDMTGWLFESGRVGLPQRARDVFVETLSAEISRANARLLKALYDLGMIRGSRIRRWLRRIRRKG